MPLTRKSTRSKTRKQANRGSFIGPVKGKGKPKQARFNASKVQYKVNKAVSRAMSRMSETKLLACSAINGTASGGTPTAVISDGSIGTVFAWRGILQTPPAGWDSDLQTLGGVTIPQGLLANQHIGNYVYYKKTHLTFQLDMGFQSDPRPPVQFRLIVGKARQLAQPSGTTDYPQNSLFLNTSGNYQGHASTSTNAMNTFEIMNQPLNKRNWVILRDSRFTLSHPYRQTYDSSAKPIGGVGYSGKYPNRKNMIINLPHYAKAKLSALGDSLSYDPKYFVYIYATSIGSLVNEPNQWTIYMRGTTSYTDN